jgi:hypothetical protein
MRYIPEDHSVDTGRPENTKSHTGFSVIYLEELSNTEISQKIWQVTGPRSVNRTSQIKTGIIPTRFWRLMANKESITKPTDLVGMQAKCFVIGLKICGG